MNGGGAARRQFRSYVFGAVGLAAVVSPGAAIQLPQLALATIISIAPVLVIFGVAQRFLVTGLTAGATKG